jgi:hypothetical protein
LHIPCLLPGLPAGKDYGLPLVRPLAELLEVVLVPVLEPVPELVPVSVLVDPPWLVLVELDVVVLGVELGILLLIVLLLELEPVVVSYVSLVPPCCLQPSKAKAAQSVMIVFFIFPIYWFLPFPFLVAGSS